jgi:hypothetical protein
MPLDSSPGGEFDGLCKPPDVNFQMLAPLGTLTDDLGELSTAIPGYGSVGDGWDERLSSALQLRIDDSEHQY